MIQEVFVWHRLSVWARPPTPRCFTAKPTTASKRRQDRHYHARGGRCADHIKGTSDQSRIGGAFDRSLSRNYSGRDDGSVSIMTYFHRRALPRLNAQMDV